MWRARRPAPHTEDKSHSLSRLSALDSSPSFCASASAWRLCDKFSSPLFRPCRDGECETGVSTRGPVCARNSGSGHGGIGHGHGSDGIRIRPRGRGRLQPFQGHQGSPLLFPFPFPLRPLVSFPWPFSPIGVASSLPATCISLPLPAGSGHRERERERVGRRRPAKRCVKQGFRASFGDVERADAGTLRCI